MKKKVVKIARPRKVKFDIDSAPNAIVDGKFIVPVGGMIIVQRMIDEKMVLCKCLVKEVRNDGWIYTWDETTVRWLTFKVTDPIIAKVMTND